MSSQMSFQILKRSIRIASRQSALALWQAEFIKKLLQTRHPHLAIEILGMSTKGDQILDIPLHKTSGKGLFVKELEEALLNHDADIAVHSMKDIPAMIPSELEIAAILEREDPRDAFVSNRAKHFLDLESGACIGTSSLRRQAQLAAIRPDLRYEYLRGNVDTRIKKLDQNAFDAIILAVAGLKRLNLEKRIAFTLEPEVMLPCVGQGALGIECRKDDIPIKEMLSSFNHVPTALCLEAERSMNQKLGGSCQLPVGGLASISETKGEMVLSGMVGLPDGSRIIKAQAIAKNTSKNTKAFGYENAKELGHEVAKQLLNQGARDIIEACCES